MRTRVRAALLLALLALAAHSAASAVTSVRSPWESLLPQEIYSGFADGEQSAPYTLRTRGGFVAVFEGENTRTPALVTRIEASLLRRADRAMLEKGIPAADREAMLQLLEDLGS